MITIHIRSDPEATFQLAEEIQIPAIGDALDLKYEDYISDYDDWVSALSTLENDLMVVDRIEGDEVWLMEGNPD